MLDQRLTAVVTDLCCLFLLSLSPLHSLACHCFLLKQNDIKKNKIIQKKKNHSLCFNAYSHKSTFLYNRLKRHLKKKKRHRASATPSTLIFTWSNPSVFLAYSLLLHYSHLTRDRECSYSSEYGTHVKNKIKIKGKEKLRPIVI